MSATLDDVVNELKKQRKLLQKIHFNRDIDENDISKEEILK